jgi:DNA recombination protein RmuC
MSEWIVFVAGAVAGLIIGCLWMLTLSRKRLASLQVDAEGKIRAAEATIVERTSKSDELQKAVVALAAEKQNLLEHVRSETAARAARESEVTQLRISLENQSVLHDRFKLEGELRVKAETQLAEAQTNLEEQKKLLQESKVQLVETFNALSADALKSNNKAFLDLAKSTFQTIQAQATGELQTQEKAIEGVVVPLRQALERYEVQLHQVETARVNAYSSLEEQIRALAGGNAQLQKETGSLVSALRSPHVRGRWGEMTLRRAAELAGMSQHCDFTEQETFEGEDGRLRPDMMVNLPGDRRIVVDVKAPLQAFLDASNAATEEERVAHLARHAQLVRSHMEQLGSKNYWEQFEHAPEIVVLFLPGESFFAAALEQDKTLIEDGMERRVILATPTTLIALLRAIAFGWRQESIAQNAKEISELGKQLYDRIATFVTHLEAVGNGLERSVDAYNRAIGSLELRVLPSARKFKELGAATGEDIPLIETVDDAPRSLEVPDGD